MRNAETAFRQSDPTKNRQFRRLWTEPARALRIVAMPPTVRSLDHLAVEIMVSWRAETVTVPADSHRLTTLAAVKGEMRLSAGADDEFLSDLIDRATATIRRWCGRIFALETVHEIFRLTAPVEELPLTRWPLVSIDSVTEGATTLTTADYEADDETGLVYRLTSSDTRRCWTAPKIVVDYSAGYILPGKPGRTLPEDVERATIMLVKAAWFSRTRDPLVKSEDVSGVLSSTFWVGGFSDGAALPPDIEGLLSPHRQPPIG